MAITPRFAQLRTLVVALLSVLGDEQASGGGGGALLMSMHEKDATKPGRTTEPSESKMIVMVVPVTAVSAGSSVPW
jgi:hypothetical protein